MMVVVTWAALPGQQFAEPAAALVSTEEGTVDVLGSLPFSLRSSAGAYHSGYGWLFGGKVGPDQNTEPAVLRFDPASRALSEVGSIDPVTEYATDGFLAVNHGSDIYLFGSSPSGDLHEGWVFRFEPATHDIELVATGALVGQEAAGFSDGQHIYLFPGRNAALGVETIWKFDPSQNALTKTHVPIPFWELPGQAPDSYKATGLAGARAVWTGSEAVLIGGLYQAGHVLTWTPGEPAMDVLPFVIPDYPWDGEAMWTGASLYWLGGIRNYAPGGPIDQIVRVELSPPGYEILDLVLREPMGRYTLVSDGSDAYLFDGDRLLFFRPWESDLPRYKLGEDFSIFSFHELDKNDRSVSADELCADDVAKVIARLNDAGQEEPYTGNPYSEAADAYLAAKEVMDDVLGVGWCLGFSISIGFDQGEASGTNGRARAYMSGLGFDIPNPVASGLRMAFLSAVAALMGLTSASAFATTGEQYFIERACHEQVDALKSSVSLNYNARGVVKAVAGGSASTAVVAVEAAPWSVGLAPKAPGYHLPVASERVTATVLDGDQDSMSIPSATEEVTRFVRSGFGVSYLTAMAGAATIGGIGLEIHRADIGTGPDLFDPNDYFAQLTSVDFSFVDDTVPEFDIMRSGEQGRSGWFVGPVETTVRGHDSESCVSLIRVLEDGEAVETVEDTWNPVVRLEHRDDGIHELEVEAANLQHEWTPRTPFDIPIDSVAPETEYLITGGSGRNGWFNTCVTLDLVGSDATSGPAEAFAFRGGDGTIESDEPQLCAEGKESFLYWSWDVAGNAESPNEGEELWIDRTPPHGGVGQEIGELGVEGWYRSCVDVEIAGYDALSGIAEIFSAVDEGPWEEVEWQEVCGDGIHQVHVRAFDVAGNEDVVRSFEVKIDTTAPDSSVTPPTLQVGSGETEVDWEASDALSGLYGTMAMERSVSLLVPGSGPWQPVCEQPVAGNADAGTCLVRTSGTGTHCFRAVVRDKAGNAETSGMECTIVTPGP